MKQPAARKSFLGIITILTVIAALLVPAPVFAAGGPGHEPPPPKPPSNDLGKKTNPGKNSPVSVSDLPGDTSVVVTNQGTALPLAAKLSIQALSARTAVVGQSVKFCKMSNPGFFGSCTSYDTIQDAIDDVASIDGETSGVFYVAVNYPAPADLPAPEIILDQGTFFDPAAASELDMLGGYNFSGKHIGTQSVHPTQLVQPLTIMNINDASSFMLDNFDINVSDAGGTAQVLEPTGALTVLNSHNVTLSDLSVTNTAPNGIGALLLDDYGNLQITNSHFDHSGFAGLVVQDFTGDIQLNNVSANSNGGSAPQVTGLTGLMVLPGAGAAITSMAGNVEVTDSQFLTNAGIGLQVSTGQETTLDNAEGSINDIYLKHVTASSNGVAGALLQAGGNVFVDHSSFNDNGYLTDVLPGGSLDDVVRDGVIAISGLSGDGGSTILTNSQATGNFFTGAVALSPDFVGETNGHFNDNGAGGLLAASLGDVNVLDTQANNNGYVGALLAAININDVFPSSNRDLKCTASINADIYGGFVCADGLEANGNGFLGAATVGTWIVDVNHSRFNGNDWLGPFSVDTGGSPTDIYGGGLVAIGGDMVSMDDVHANDNLGFGAGAFNGGGFLSMFDNLFSPGAAILDGLAPSAYALDLSNLYTLPVFNSLGSIYVSDSTFSGNTAWGLEAQLESHTAVMPPGLDSIGGYTEHVGNLIDLSNVKADDNGNVGIFANIASYELPVPSDYGTAGITDVDGFIATRNLGNFIDMDTVQASRNGNLGIAATIDFNNLDQTEQGQSGAPVAEGINLNSSHSYYLDLTFNWGNFITLNHIITNDNFGGLVADIRATGATENIFGVSEGQDNSGTLNTLDASSNHVNAQADLTKLYTVNSGNQISLSDVTANRNDLWGVNSYIYSDEQRINILSENSFFVVPDSIVIGDGSASLSSDVNQSLHITLTAGDLINMDRVTANDNSMTGIEANITSQGDASNTINVAPVSTTVNDAITLEDGPAKITSHGTVDVQVDLFSGQQINLSNVNANRNELGITTEIDELGSDMGLTYIENNIFAIEDSGSDNNIAGLDGNAKINSDWRNSLKTSIQSGATINMDGVQADDNPGLGIFTEIYTDTEMTNVLNATLISSSGNVITNVTGSGKETATLNNLLDASIVAGNQITFHDVDASHNSSGPCAFDQQCNAGSGISALIFAGGSIQNNLNPVLGSNFTNVDVVTQGEGINLSEDITNNLLTTIHTGNLIDLKTVNANANDQFGIHAGIDDHIKYDNVVTQILNSVTNQVAMAPENPALTLAAHVDNDIQSLLDSGNTIHMQNVDASQNGFGGIWSEVSSHDMIDNILQGTLTGTNLNVPQVGSGNGSVQSDYSNTFGINLFSEDGIQMEHINASFNGLNPQHLFGDGIFAVINGNSLRDNSINPSLESISNNQTNINEGQAGLISNEQNDLLVNADVNNFITLADVVANGNTRNGVNAQVSSEETHLNGLTLNLASNGTNLVTSQAGDTRLGSNLTDNAIGFFNDLNGISVRNLMADNNGMNGVMAGVDSRVDRSAFMVITATVTQSNEIDYVTGSPNFNTNVGVDADGIVNVADFIDMNNVTANLNSLFGVNAFVSSNDTLVANINISSTVTVNNIIGAIVLDESQDIIKVPSASVVDNPNSINLNNVTANHNTLSGTVLEADAVNVRNSTFMYNGAYGLDLTGDSVLINVKACHNVLGPETHTGNLFTDNFDTLYCPEEGAGVETAGGGAGAEAAGMPWQIINVYMDPGKNSGTLSCQFGTTYLYLEKMGTPATDFEWGRVELAPCIVPGGTVGTLTGLGQGALPGALPDGVTFQGKAFDFELTGAGGSPVSLGGLMNVRFTLPAGFTLPSGKKLAILWFDPAAKQWVELTTYAGGVYANAYASKTGAFVLVIK